MTLGEDFVTSGMFRAIVLVVVVLAVAAAIVVWQSMRWPVDTEGSVG
jgi:hypothetical protein